MKWRYERKYRFHTLERGDGYDLAIVGPHEGGYRWQLTSSWGRGDAKTWQGARREAEAAIVASAEADIKALSRKRSKGAR